MLTKLKALTIVPPNRPLVGRVTPPGSKSITNRALLLAALAKGKSRITGALKSKDTQLMAVALRQMGVVVDEPDDTSFVVTGTGKLAAPAAPLMLGNAGTAVRFLTAAVALVDGIVVVDGDEHMRKRPIGPLVTALRSLGIEASAPTGCPPVMVEGRGHFGAGRVEIDGGLSSQYVSALLMAAPFGEGPITVALTGKDLEQVKDEWLYAMSHAINSALVLQEHGLHKQIANRILEPWSHINVLVTATEWDNFFELRCHPAAQPEMRVLAEAIRSAMDLSQPRFLEPGQWHLPYVEDDGTSDAIKVSVARCARVSYLTHDGRETTLEEDLELYERLVGSQPIHASPADHQATPDEDHLFWGYHNPGQWRNFRGWRQYRALIES